MAKAKRKRRRTRRRLHSPPPRKYKLAELNKLTSDELDKLKLTVAGLELEGQDEPPPRPVLPEERRLFDRALAAEIWGRAVDRSEQQSRRNPGQKWLEREIKTKDGRRQPGETKRAWYERLAKRMRAAAATTTPGLRPMKPASIGNRILDWEREERATRAVKPTR